MQHTSPATIHQPLIHNNISWYWLAVAIVVGTALISHGAQAMFERWERDAELPSWFSILGDILGIVMAIGVGAGAGYLIWHWALGALCGAVGGWGHHWIMPFLSARFGKAKSQ